MSELVRLVDPTTEVLIFRLTEPAHTSLLPAPGRRFFHAKQRALVFSSDRSGLPAPFLVDLRNGAIRQIADTAALRSDSLCLDAGGRFLYFLDGNNLKQAELSGKKRSDSVLEGVTDFALGYSRSELFVIRKDRLEQVHGFEGELLAESAEGPLYPQPGGAAGCLFWRNRASDERELWLGAAAGKPAQIAAGRISDPCWSSNGQTVLFLRQVEQSGVMLSEIHEWAPGQVKERCLTQTSQFAAFSPNADDSVFVGASRSKAQPNVVILLRSVGRELTLCEHRASNATQVRPSFSPDSRRVYYQSDHEGKYAIYSVNVEALIEPTQAGG